MSELEQHPGSPSPASPGRAIAHISGSRSTRDWRDAGDVVDVLRARAAALEELATTVERLYAEGWRTAGEVGLAFSLGVDGVGLERDLASFAQLAQVAPQLPFGSVIHWHRNDRSWRSGGWIVGLPADQQLGETDDLPVIVQSTRSGRQTLCEDQQQLVAAVELHLREIAEELDLDPAQATRAGEVREQVAALSRGEPPQVYYRFEGSLEAEDVLTSAHVVLVAPEATARWEGFHDGVTRQPVYDGDHRLEGLTGLAFRDGYRLGGERAHLLTDAAP